jgi:hypothetical protein
LEGREFGFLLDLTRIRTHPSGFSVYEHCFWTFRASVKNGIGNAWERSHVWCVIDMGDCGKVYRVNHRKKGRVALLKDLSVASCCIMFITIAI